MAGKWLGHRSPAYTLSEYVHLIDAGVGEAGFLDLATAWDGASASSSLLGAG